MGFFSKDMTDTTGGLEPVSNDRLARLFDERETSYGRDEDGDLGGFWQDHLFIFWHAGEDGQIFQVRGRWLRGVAEAQYGTVLELVNEWNRDKLWPKAYVEVHEGELVVFAEHTVHYGEGATDEQVDLHLGSAINSSLSLFEHLDERFPEETAVAKAAAAAEHDE